MNAERLVLIVVSFFLLLPRSPIPDPLECLFARAQAFPRLIPISRGRQAKGSPVDVSVEEEAAAGASNARSLDRVTQSFSESCGVDDKQSNQERGGEVDGGGKAGLLVARSSKELGGARGDFSRIPPLLALLHVVRGVPPEALSPELDAVIPAVVQALRSDHAPLRSTALGTFQVQCSLRIKGLQENANPIQLQHLQDLVLLEIMRVKTFTIRRAPTGDQQLHSVEPHLK